MVPLLVLITSVMGFLSLLSSLIDSRGEIQHRIASAWGRTLMAVFLVEMRLSGTERLESGQSYVFASNHFSLIDTPLMFGLMPRPFRILARSGLWKIPFIGWHLKRAGHLPVNRTNPRIAARNIAYAAEKVREGRSILIFPEGGRRRGDTMRRFKTGAAHIANQAGVPIVPVAIAGTSRILPPGSLHLRPGVAEVRIGEPIPTAGANRTSANVLTDRVREAIERLAADPGSCSEHQPNGDTG
ncbi:MAG: lysophospholipid acyltransferase family protein [Bryobacterales bacterium]|nr:lysophospholipid acyltransferase family protein [Bryobacterales bacterium]